MLRRVKEDRGGKNLQRKPVQLYIKNMTIFGVFYEILNIYLN